MVSDMIIEIYAIESALLRGEKLLHGKRPERATIPIKITKVLLHDSTGRISSLARRALEALEDPAAAEVFRLRFFAGMSVAEAAEYLDVHRGTANRNWTYARAWVRAQLSAGQLSQE